MLVFAVAFHIVAGIPLGLKKVTDHSRTQTRIGIAVIETGPDQTVNYNNQSTNKDMFSAITHFLVISCLLMVILQYFLPPIIQNEVSALFSGFIVPQIILSIIIPYVYIVTHAHIKIFAAKVCNDAIEKMLE